MSAESARSSQIRKFHDKRLAISHIFDLRLYLPNGDGFLLQNAFEKRAHD